MNDGFDYREGVASRAAGRQVHAYLSERYRHTSPTDWLAHIAAGRVLVDDDVATADQVLRRGQSLVWHRPAWEEPDAPLSFDVLHVDDDVVVVAKPSGLPTMPGGGFLQHTLVHQVRQRFSDAAPAHRLGRFTSGVVVCGRGRGAGASLAAQLVARTMHKRYRALASGTPGEDAWTTEVPIGPVPYAPLGTLHAASPDGRAARSRVRVVERRDACFLADVVIETGRPHQIRIHLAAAGFALVGDPLYGTGGRPAPGCVAVPGDPGYWLHAAELVFAHPGTGEALRVCAPCPGPLRSAPEGVAGAHVAGDAVR